MSLGSSLVSYSMRHPQIFYSCLTQWQPAGLMQLPGGTASHCERERLRRAECRGSCGCGCNCPLATLEHGWRVCWTGRTRLVKLLPCPLSRKRRVLLGTLQLPQSKTAEGTREFVFDCGVIGICTLCTRATPLPGVFPCWRVCERRKPCASASDAHTPANRDFEPCWWGGEPRKDIVLC